ncbi:haloacid dehalogenase [Cellulomonas sp. Root485]|uniref:HAD hydrolase-like protein n=1 Tax=Cellulomonas sp. Root485 TaxID=1736546 RepID=UPI0006FFC536|nr:HAD hydrolase-like protein [Cellulomonas sp. Root485]KQY20681.1 haloacid dehalogenase [Cellulomonas sp. Root485]
MTSPLVLLDLDGTLLDSISGITASISVAFRRCGLPIPTTAELRAFVGPPIGDSMRAHGVPEDRVDEVITAYREDFGVTGMYDATVYDGVPELLADLRAAGCRLVVATSKPEPFAVPICADRGLTPLLDGVFGAPLDESGTKADVIARALAAEPEPATSALMVGDREHDVHGARENGLDCVGVTWGYAAPGELAAAGAVVIVGTVDELRRTVLARLGDTIAPRA